MAKVKVLGTMDQVYAGVFATERCHCGHRADDHLVISRKKGPYTICRDGICPCVR